jgi:hydroxymethylglutaryl-CoA reductase
MPRKNGHGIEDSGQEHANGTGSPTSRVPGMHKWSVRERVDVIAHRLGVDPGHLEFRLRDGLLSVGGAERLIENVIGLHNLPLAVAPNFIVNGRETLVPMVIEEASVVAAAGNAARIARAGGGFRALASEPVMACQIQLFVDDIARARRRVNAARSELLERASDVDRELQLLGGGPRGLELRTIRDRANPEQSFLVVHLLVDVRDAMGANAVNSMGEAIAPRLERLTGGRRGPAILTNLATERSVRVEVSIPPEALAFKRYTGDDVRDSIVSSSRFAELDPFRAATHNKGIMNGIDAVLVATGNDWRAVEAGAHAFAARHGRYEPLCTWSVGPDRDLRGILEMPLPVGIVGGATRALASASLARLIMGAESAATLAEVTASAGMASNLAALRALSTEGIQKGHLRLHRRRGGQPRRAGTGASR